MVVQVIEGRVAAALTREGRPLDPCAQMTLFDKYGIVVSPPAGASAVPSTTVEFPDNVAYVLIHRAPWKASTGMAVVPSLSVRICVRLNHVLVFNQSASSMRCRCDCPAFQTRLVGQDKRPRPPPPRPQWRSGSPLNNPTLTVVTAPPLPRLLLPPKAPVTPPSLSTSPVTPSVT